MFDLGQLFAQGSNAVQNNVIAPADNMRQQILQAPRGREALVQAALNLLQPVGFGQSGLGHIGQAIGGAMQARDRGIKADLEAEDLAKRRQMEADRAELAREEVGIRRENLGLQREELGQRRTESEQRLGLEERRVGADEKRGLAALIRAQRADTRPTRNYYEEQMLKAMDDVSKDLTIPEELKPARIQEIQTRYAPYIRKSAAAPASSGLEPGTEIDGFIYQGGDPNDASSWVRAE